MVTLTATGMTCDVPQLAVGYDDSSKGWLSAATGTAGALTVGAAVAGLAPATYVGHVTVTCAGAANSPLQLPVTFVVSAKPPQQITLSPASLVFGADVGGADPAAQQVTIADLYGTMLATPVVSVSPPEASAWLATSLVSQSAPPRHVLSVVPTTGALAAGTYSAQLAVDCAGAANTPQNVAVTVVVTQPAAPPTLALTPSPASLSFTTMAGSSDLPKTVTASNVGGGALAGPELTFVQDNGSGTWLVGSVSGPAGGPYTISVSASAAALDAGTYTGHVDVASAGASSSPQQIAVTFTVQPRPVLALDQSALSFGAVAGGADPKPVFVTLSNAAGGPLPWPTSATVYDQGAGGWLTVYSTPVPPAPATPDHFLLQVIPNVGQLAPGTYHAHYDVIVNSAANSPLSLSVTFTVTAPSCNDLDASLAPLVASYDFWQDFVPPTGGDIVDGVYYADWDRNYLGADPSNPAPVATGKTGRTVVRIMGGRVDLAQTTGSVLSASGTYSVSGATLTIQGTCPGPFTQVFGYSSLVFPSGRTLLQLVDGVDVTDLVKQ